MELLKDVKQEGIENGPLKKTVTNTPGGLAINVEHHQVRYNIDGKTYDDPAQLPPEIRAKINQAMGQGVRPGRDVNVIQVRTDIQRRSAPGATLMWVLVGAVALIVLLSFFL
jgi:hypothetical protein